MKKTISMILCAVLLAGCSSTAQSAKTISTTQTVKADTVTGASTTRTVLSGDDYDAAMTDLEVVSNDLATKAETEKAGYEEKEDAKLAQVMSVMTMVHLLFQQYMRGKLKKVEIRQQLLLL